MTLFGRSIGRWLGVAVGFVALAGLGCAASKPVQKEKPYAPSFDYTPLTGAAPGSADVTFALVSPRYAEDAEWTRVPPFTEFAENLGLDFQEILTARGYTVRGPFRTYDEMTFPDKKGSDLALVPILDVRLDISDATYEEKINLFTGKTYVLKGNATISGRVTLSMQESLSNERMWMKSIELERTTVAWVGEREYKVPPSGVDLSDPGIVPALGKPLEAIYALTMETAWKHLDPEEMALVKKQAQEIKEKKVY